LNDNAIPCIFVQCWKLISDKVLYKLKLFSKKTRPVPLHVSLYLYVSLYVSLLCEIQTFIRWRILLENLGSTIEIIPQCGLRDEESRDEVVIRR